MVQRKIKQGEKSGGGAGLSKDMRLKYKRQQYKKKKLEKRGVERETAEPGIGEKKRCIS